MTTNTDNQLILSGQEHEAIHAALHGAVSKATALVIDAAANGGDPQWSLVVQRTLDFATANLAFIHNGMKNVVENEQTGPRIEAVPDTDMVNFWITATVAYSGDARDFLVSEEADDLTPEQRKKVQAMAEYALSAAKKLVVYFREQHPDIAAKYAETGIKAVREGSLPGWNDPGQERSHETFTQYLELLNGGPFATGRLQ